MFDLKPLERVLPHPIPKDYVHFMKRARLPRLLYLSGEDLASLFGFDASTIIEANENLRDSGLNPHPWREEYLAIGERTEDEAIFCLDLSIKTLPSPMFVLEKQQERAVQISPDFTRWALEQIEALTRADEQCKRWHRSQYPRWLRPFARWFEARRKKK